MAENKAEKTKKEQKQKKDIEPEVDQGQQKSFADENAPEPQAQQAQEPQSQQVDELQQRLALSEEKYLRLMAEFDNFKRRTAAEYTKMVDMANEKLITELIEVRENFGRALLSGAEAEQNKAFFDGMKMIYNKFEDILTKNGLESFSEPGDEFDPEIHDALMNAPHDQIEQGCIAQVFEKGYKLKGRVIKHGRVVISSGKPPAADS